MAFLFLDKERLQHWQDLFLFKQFLKHCWLSWRYKNVNPKKISSISIEPYGKERGSPRLYNLMLAQCFTKRKVNTLILEKPVSFCYHIEDRQTLPSIYLTLAQFLICLLTALQARGINLKPHHKKLALSQRRCCLKLLIFHSEHIIKLELLLIY